MAALAEELGQLARPARSAHGEADRLRQAIGVAEAARDRDVAGLAELEQRLARAAEDRGRDRSGPGRPGSAGRRRPGWPAPPRWRRGWRCGRWRNGPGRWPVGPTPCVRAAASERRARAKARPAANGCSVRHASPPPSRPVPRTSRSMVERSLDRAAGERSAAESARAAAESALTAAPSTGSGPWARTSSRWSTPPTATRWPGPRSSTRVETLVEKAMTELGLDAEALVRDYGPDRPVPGADPARRQRAGPRRRAARSRSPYVRDQQHKRLRVAERALGVLGRVNPLALEEFDAMQERHQFLADPARGPAQDPRPT